MVFVGIVMAAVYSFYQQSRIQATLLPKITENLILPYIELLAEQKYQAAYL